MIEYTCCKTPPPQLKLQVELFDQLPTQSTFLFAEQEAVVPPPEPTQFHVHGPAPETNEAVPALHKFVDGAEYKFEPLDEPHEPFTTAG